MLKISQAGKPGQNFTLKLEGRVVGPRVGELKQICEPLVNNGSTLTLDLADVSFADQHGAAVLASFSQRGVRLINPTPFLTEQLKMAAPATLN